MTQKVIATKDLADFCKPEAKKVKKASHSPAKRHLLTMAGNL